MLLTMAESVAVPAISAEFQMILHSQEKSVTFITHYSDTMQHSYFIRSIFLTGIVCFAFIFPSFSQQDSLHVNDTLVKKDTIDYYDMSIEQLQKLKAVGVSSDLEKLINSL